MTNKVLNEKECYMCKLISAGLFTGIAGFHFYRVKALWRKFPVKEKIFNTMAIGFLLGISLLNVNAAVQIVKGQRLMLDDVRPSLFRRLSGELSLKQKQELLDRQIELEEEKMKLLKMVSKEAS